MKLVKYIPPGPDNKLGYRLYQCGCGRVMDKCDNPKCGCGEHIEEHAATCFLNIVEEAAKLP